MQHNIHVCLYTGATNFNSKHSSKIIQQASRTIFIRRVEIKVRLQGHHRLGVARKKKYKYATHWYSAFVYW